MLLRRAVVLGSLLSALLLPSELLLAGNNAGGTARLSWDPAGTTTDLSEVPTAPFPLYLLIDGAPDIQQLAYGLQWSPFDTLGCFTLLPADADSTCGWDSAVPPIGDFEGDSTYTRSINFPPTIAERNCVGFLFSGDACIEAAPASFCLEFVKIKDSLGAVDELEITGFASLLGGVPDGCASMQLPMLITDVFPDTVWRGELAELTLIGRNFATGSVVQLLNWQGEPKAMAVAIAATPETLHAQVVAPAEAEGALTVVVSDKLARIAVLEDAVQAVAPEYTWGVLVDGQPAPPILDAPQGIFSTAGVGDCPPPAIPTFFRALPSVFASARCPDVPDQLSKSELAFFLLRSTGDTVRTSCEITITVATRANSGGHCHDDTEKPTGTPLIKGMVHSGNLLGGYHRVTQTWPEVSGSILFQVEPVMNDVSCPNWTFIGGENFWAAVRGPNPQPFDAGLQSMAQEGPGFLLESGYLGVDTTAHPDPNHVIPQMNGALVFMAHDWWKWKPEGARLIYHNASLVWGGLLDVCAEGPGGNAGGGPLYCLEAPTQGWTPPECSHRDGTEIYIRIGVTDPSARYSQSRALFYWLRAGTRIVPSDPVSRDTRTRFKIEYKYRDTLFGQTLGVFHVKLRN